MELPDEKRKEYTMGYLKINLLSFLFIVLIFPIFLVPFLFIWPYSALQMGLKQFIQFIIPIFIVGIVVHEGLHGLGWAIFAKNGFKSIRFGVNWKYLTPYCHCKEPLKLKHYFIGTVLPLVVTGIAPAVIAIIIGNGLLVCLGIFFTWAAAGDAIMLFSMRRLKWDTLIADHPDKIGFFVIDNV